MSLNENKEETDRYVREAIAEIDLVKAADDFDAYKSEKTDAIWAYVGDDPSDEVIAIADDGCYTISRYRFDSTVSLEENIASLDSYIYRLIAQIDIANSYTGDEDDTSSAPEQTTQVDLQSETVETTAVPSASAAPSTGERVSRNLIAGVVMIIMASAVTIIRVRKDQSFR